ncbi:hypothetical protein CPC08DRAFT_615715, partial [Agrocybe pediades]
WFEPTSFRTLNPPREVHFGDESCVHATGIGSITLRDKVNGKDTLTTLENVLYIPTFKLTLVSVRKLDKDGYYSIFKDRKCSVKLRKGRKIVLVGKHR